MLRFKEYLNEAFNIPIVEPTDIDAFDTPYDKKELKKVLDHVKTFKLADIPIVGDGDSKEKKGTIKIRFAGLEQGDITDWIKNNTSLPKKAYDFGTGSLSKSGDKSPSGAQWESLITHQINKILKDENFDKDAVEISKIFPNYVKQAAEVAKGFREMGVTSKMTQYGGGGGKENLSTKWIKWGGTNGTPKTDMYTKNFNISLKKKGGSQLASGGSGETISTFNAALEYLGESREDHAVIDEIMKDIEENFLTLQTKFNKTDLGKIAAGKSKMKLSTDDKEVIKDYSKTEAFHKELNKAIKDKMTFEKMPEFLKWYCFEAMSGVKKFSNPTSVASICATFDPKTGKVTTINVTKNGKKSGLKGTPTVSTEVENLAKKIKIFAAWKSAGKNPRSVLRLTSSYEPENTLRGIMLDELYKDQYTKSCIQELNEETDQLDEFAIIRKAMDKVKSLAGSAKKWISDFFKKIMVRVKKTLLAIKKLGAKMFDALLKFLGLELKSVKETIPTDIHGFVYGMAD